jgi:hypothetical protein
MLDTAAITQMIEKEISATVQAQVSALLTSDAWIRPLEQKILQHTQDRIVAKFASSDSMPEILDAVKHSVAQLFKQGQVPGVSDFVKTDTVKHAVDQAIAEFVAMAVGEFSEDPVWQARVEHMINQTVTQETLSRVGALDIMPTIRDCVHEHMQRFTSSMLENFRSTGIQDQATQCELTVMNNMVVVEHGLTVQSLQVMDTAQVNNLVVTGNINTDNDSWQALTSEISQRTLDQVTESWTRDLVSQVTQLIQQQGISFDSVKVGGVPLIDGAKLSATVTESNLQTVGKLRSLQVHGEARFNNNTVTVLNRRLGINTETPEKALSVWDEEVSVVIGKHKTNQAYVGTNRDQGLVLGVNREPQLEIATDGLTTIKKLRVGLHKIGHDSQVPGWSGTRGDLVFNTSPGADRVFAWVCLGAHRWQTLKSAE